jgi:hypothetical protein
MSCLVLDTLAIHMVRDIDSSTIISYHPNPECDLTPARGLHARFRLAGEGVYWQNMLKSCADSSCLLTILLWHAVYAWDEALGILYSHICFLVSLLITVNRRSLTVYIGRDSGD